MRTFPHLFEPLFVKHIRFKNRIFSAPNMICSMDANGFPTTDMIGYYAEKARGGAAVVTVGDTPVDKEHAPSNPRSFNLSYESLPFLSEIATAIHEHDAKASLELNHGGFVNPPQAIAGKNPIGPVSFIRKDGVLVEAMDEKMIFHVAENFAKAAQLLKTAGFDMCVIHGGHGWLLDQFLSPLYNTRSDNYGGSLENRARFPLLVIDHVREAVGNDFLIEYRMSGSEEIEGGLSKEEGIAFAQLIDDKVDLIHVSAALDTVERQAVHTHPTIFLPHGVNVHYAKEIKKHVKSPVITVGAISNPQMAENILANQEADIIAMTRAIIADPYFPEKAKNGLEKEIIPCVRCLNCLTGMHTGQHFACSVNPRTGREFRLNALTPIPAKSKKLLIVGGGVAGMVAAVTAAQRGHKVMIATKESTLGGLLSFTDFDSLKEDLHRYKEYLIHMVDTLHIKVIYNTEINKNNIGLFQFDGIIIATGSTPIVPPIPGLDLPNVCHALTAYTQLEKLSNDVAIIGGGLVGCEVGLFLAERGHNVKIVEAKDTIAPEANWMHKEGMMEAFEKTTIRCFTQSKVIQITKDGLQVEDPTGKANFIPASSVVYAVGMKPCNNLLEQLKDFAPYVRAVGDCVKVGTVQSATFDGYHAALDFI